MREQKVSETMTPDGFGDPVRRLDRIENDLARMFCVVLHNFENPLVANDITTTSYQSREAIAVNRYQSDAMFHSKIRLLTQQSMRIIEQYI